MKVSEKKKSKVQVCTTGIGNVYGLEAGGYVIRIEDPNKLVQLKPFQFLFVNIQTGVLHFRDGDDIVLSLSDVELVIS